MSVVHRKRTRGVALIEALVALAVMAFGMLAMVGIQGVLRGNSDIAKQRSEAVRLAQEAIEEWRAFAVLETDASVVYRDYTDIATQTDAAITGVNATYTRQRTVTTLPAPQGGKTLQVNVAWSDRVGEAQSVQLTSVIAAVAPELAATLAAPSDGTPVRQPFSRSRGIPVLAKDLSDGTSGLKPPGAPDPRTVWLFNNTTGIITFCQTTASSTAGLVAGLSGNISSCSGNAIALTGFIRYPLSPTTLPTALDALNPTGSAPSPPPVALYVNYTEPSPGGVTPDCFTNSISTHTTYFCAVPVTVVANRPLPVWSGRVVFTAGVSSPNQRAIAVNATDNSSARVRICRYSAVPAGYTGVSAPRSDQNFLVIAAGDGSIVFGCPTGTSDHQP